MGVVSQLKKLNIYTSKGTTDESKVTDDNFLTADSPLKAHIYYMPIGEDEYKEFSNGQSLTFCENDTISGKFELTSEKPLYNVSIRVTFIGENTLKKDKQRIILEKDNLSNNLGEAEEHYASDDYNCYSKNFLEKNIYLFGSNDVNEQESKDIINGLTQGKHIFPFKIDLLKFSKDNLINSAWFLKGHVRYLLRFDVIMNSESTISLFNDIKMFSEIKDNLSWSFGKKITANNNNYKFILRTDKRIYSPNDYIETTIGIKLLDNQSLKETEGATLISNVGIIATFCRIITLTPPNSKPKRYKQKLSQSFSPIVFNKDMFTKENVCLKIDKESQYMPTLVSDLFSIAYFIEINLTFEVLEKIKTYNNETIKLSLFSNTKEEAINIDPSVLSYKIKEDLMEKRNSSDHIKSDLQIVFFQNFLKADSGAVTIMAEVQVKNQCLHTNKDSGTFVNAFTATHPKGFDLYDVFLGETTCSEDYLEEQEAPEF